jgi:Methyltransferase domain
MTPEESIAWHPTHPGGSTDILPFYSEIAPLLPQGGTFVEIGCFFGRSLSFMGTLRPDLQLWAIDPWEDQFVDAGEVLPVGPDLELCRKHGGLFSAFLAMMKWHAPEVLARARIIRAPSHVGMRVVDRADMVFIDGDHSLEAVRRDIVEARRVVGPGGIIAGHDYCWNNFVTRAVREAFPKHELGVWPLPREGWAPGHSSVWWTRQDAVVAQKTAVPREVAVPHRAAVPQNAPPPAVRNESPRSSHPRVTVISTGFKAPTAHLCRASVAAQVGVQVEHRYVEASEQRPPKTKIENLLEQVADLPPDRIVALVDGDDWLAHPEALARVAETHRRGAWVTYGQFMDVRGGTGFAAPYERPDYRQMPWLATHLKTFRAGLMQRIDPEDLKFEGSWIERDDDPAFMFPILEMAGHRRQFFIADILYVYNSTASWETTAPAGELARQAMIDKFIRAKKPYPQIPSL